MWLGVVGAKSGAPECTHVRVWWVRESRKPKRAEDCLPRGRVPRCGGTPLCRGSMLDCMKPSLPYKPVHDAQGVTTKVLCSEDWETRPSNLRVLGGGAHPGLSSSSEPCSTPFHCHPCRQKRMWAFAFKEIDLNSNLSE